MKALLAGLVGLACISIQAATTWPASTNADQTFFGHNTFLQPIIGDGSGLSNLNSGALSHPLINTFIGDGSGLSNLNSGALSRPVTNSFYYISTNNGISVTVPLHDWAFLSISNAGTYVTLTGTSVYATITNWNVIVTNGFTGSAARGVLTNSEAGWYRVSFSVSSQPTANDQIEADITLNGTNMDLIAAHTAAFGSAKQVNMGASGIEYLPIGTQISLKIQNLNSTTLAIAHAQLVVGSP